MGQHTISDHAKRATQRDYRNEYSQPYKSILSNFILDDLFTIFHWLFLPSIILLIMYSEMQDNVKNWLIK